MLLLDVSPGGLFSFQGNPFAALTLIAAPAVLTNACSVLALGTSNRFARAVDRQRDLTKQIQADTGTPPDREVAALQLRQLQRANRLAELVIRALTSFYVALGSFAVTGLASLAGAVAGEQHLIVASLFGFLALGAGLAGVGGLVTGCTLLVRETSLTLGGLREESSFVLQRYRQTHPDPETSEPG